MLLDTSGLFCYHHYDEPQHIEAATFFQAARVRLTHSYVLAEFVPLCQARGLNRTGALAFAVDLVDMIMRPLRNQRAMLVCLILGLISLVRVDGAGAVARFNQQAASAPEVLKVEPPNWWLGHSINPVRVMIRGRNLAGARVEASGAGVQTGLTRVNAAGTYLFVDVLIDSPAAPGPRPLKITTERGTTTVPFNVLAPLPREGRFQGFSPDDVIYLIMPDRFANGDPSNDDPPNSRGLLNRQKNRYYHGGDLQGIIDRMPDEQAVFEHVRRLTRLRRELEPLRRGWLVNLDVTEQTYAYARVTDRDSVVVLFNNGTQPATIECKVDAAHLIDGDMLRDQLGITPDARVEREKIKITLPARSASVYIRGR
ncbi:MAG: cyclomaltodextrinase N-terminal domain-containing protein [Acidobacteria bacterium]|nr:cyclomaltodextrinase N-terminal domain-containing protein [Acidobacteriota bacterium]